jgi:hypothetical protein
MDISADSQTQYDIWNAANGCVGRNSSCSAVPSMNAGPHANMHEAARGLALALRDWHYPGYPLPEIDDTIEARPQISQWHRDAIEHTYGIRSPLPDSMMTDSHLYFMFPQSAFWLCESLPFTYCFTPHATDPQQSYFDVRMLLPCPAGKPRPPSAPVIEVGPDERVFDKAPAFGFLGYVFDQDMSNMPLIQRGVRSAAAAHKRSNLGLYQEMIIQHWNALIDRCLNNN